LHDAGPLPIPPPPGVEVAEEADDEDEEACDDCCCNATGHTQAASFFWHNDGAKSGLDDSAKSHTTGVEGSSRKLSLNLLED